MSSETPNNSEVTMAVKRIKVLSFSINEKVTGYSPATLVKVEMAQNLAFSVDINVVDFTLRVFYRLPNDNTEENILVDITVQNFFEVSNLKRFLVQPTQINLPENVIVSIVGLSISHTRALLAQNLAGTVIQDSIMSIVNPVDVAKHFFPYMFVEKKQDIEELIRTAE
jgi:hypothetical protein